MRNAITEALARRGLDVTRVEAMPSVLTTVDADLRTRGGEREF